MRKILILSMILLSYCTVKSQNKISGRINNQDNLPMAGATIFILELNKGTLSDKNGYYELVHLPDGKIKLQYSFIGYSNKIETVILKDSNITMNVVLHETSVETEEIVVSGGYNLTQHENTVKIEIIKLDPLALKTTPNFMEVLTKVPGIDMISKGSGVSKPVIRGLSMNDILVLNNGVRFENYQYSSHHPLGIDEFGIGDVEIIKGPASLLYGSDAIGGVINFIKEKPAPVGEIIGDYNLQLFSNTLGLTNNLGIKGSTGKISGGLRFGQKTNADFLQGGGEYAPNSRFNEYSLKANTGYTDKTGSYKLYYDHSKQNLGLVEEEAIDQIFKRARACEIFYQQLNTHLLSSQNKLYLGKLKLDLNSAYQNTGLIHFSEANFYEIQMKLKTLTYEAKLYLPSDINSEYILGFQGMNQKNQNINGRETILLPNAITKNYSVFGLLQRSYKKLKFQSGIRYDIKSINSEAVGLPGNPDFRSALNKTYRSFSGSIGSIYNISENLLFRANVAAAFRTPNLAELTSNGQHETRYEVGDQNLIPEKSFETDLNIHYHIDNLTLDIAGFYNKVNNYIFISPTGESTISGIPVYRYKQNNSSLYGGEVSSHLHPQSLKWLHLETDFSWVIGKQQNDDYLPFVPASKLNFEIRAEKKHLLFIHKAFVSIRSNNVFAQTKTASDETTTNGYSLMDLSFGGNIEINNQVILVGVGANNIFDKKYIDHLSTLKEVGLYNPGRNITLTLKVPFTIKNVKY